MEEELLSIVMVLEEFCFMFLVAVIFIYTDHKKLSFATFNYNSVSCWHMYMEEYGPTIFYNTCNKKSFLIHYHGSHTLMCCQSQQGIMLLLFFSTSLVKTLTSGKTLICSSASSTSHYPTLQRTTLLTSI